MRRIFATGLTVSLLGSVGIAFAAPSQAATCAATAGKSSTQTIVNNVDCTLV